LVTLRGLFTVGGVQVLVSTQIGRTHFPPWQSHLQRPLSTDP